MMSCEERYNLDVAIRFFRFWSYIRMEKIKRSGRRPNDFDLRLMTREMVARLRQFGLIAGPSPYESDSRVLH